MFLVFGTELVDGAPTGDVSRTEVFGAISGTIFLVAGHMEYIAGTMVTEMGVVGLVPVPRKQIT